jgi:hypothetical protein
MLVLTNGGLSFRWNYLKYFADRKKIRARAMLYQLMHHNWMFVVLFFARVLCGEPTI